MALGAAAVARDYSERPRLGAAARGEALAGPLQGFRDLGAALGVQQERAFLAQGLVASCAGAGAVKYGSLLIDAPFHPSYSLALAMIGVPAAAWAALFVVRGGVLDDGGAGGRDN